MTTESTTSRHMTVGKFIAFQVHIIKRRLTFAQAYRNQLSNEIVTDLQCLKRPTVDENLKSDSHLAKTELIFAKATPSLTKVSQ